MDRDLTVWELAGFQWPWQRIFV